MPSNNAFQHQNYPTVPVVAPVIQKVSVEDSEGVEFSQLHTRLKIGKVILVPGTFRGDDPFAFAALLSGMTKPDHPMQGMLNSLAGGLKKATVAITESVVGDIANYTDEYQQQFEQLVGGDPAVEILDPLWSGQNNHQARADLAIKLLLQLKRVNPSPERMMLFWGHSHAGNGLAILTNLLANNRVAVRRFFEAAGQTSDEWLEAESLLRESPSPHPWARSVCIAAFGTPVRYGWDSAGYRFLLHLMHHRNQQPPNSILTRPIYPMHAMKDILAAKYGDWVQAFAVAGTDVTLPALEEVESRFATILEAGLQPAVIDEDLQKIKVERIREACARWKPGTRCHTDGHHLLLEYEPSGRTTKLGIPVENARFGHGVATTTTWLPVHLALVMRALASNL
ncbi:MAG: hypothetical protein ABJZ55_26130 [Fuerstiella sp.]